MCNVKRVTCKSQRNITNSAVPLSYTECFSIFKRIASTVKVQVYSHCSHWLQQTAVFHGKTTGKNPLYTDGETNLATSW